VRIRLKNILTALLSLGVLLLSYGVKGQCGGYSFTVNDSTVCIPQVIKFSVTGTPPAGTTYRWDFGSGFNPGQDTISQLYLIPGKFDVRLELSFPNNTKCIITKRDFIEAGRKPIVNLTVDKTVYCSDNDSIAITDLTPNSAKRDYIIEGVRYDSLDKVSTHKFSITPGPRDVSAIVTDSLGCETIDNFVALVNVPNKYTFDFTTDSTNGCTNRYANFAYKELIGGQEPDKYTWEFQNATPSLSNDTNPQNIFYSSQDSSDVKLIIETKEGCTYEVVKEKWMTLADPIALKINVTQTDPCVGEYIKYDVSNSQNKMIDWQFFPDDFKIHGSTDTSLTGEHRTAGSKVVRASQIFKGCLSQTDSRNKVKVVGPESRFISDKSLSCYDKATVKFTNQSIEPPNEIITYKWYIKDGLGNIIDSAFTKDHTYSFDGFGSYSVALICYSNKNGCTDTLEKLAMIRLRSMEASTDIDPNLACIAQPIAIKSTTPVGSSLAPNIYKWEIFDENDVLVKTSTLDSFTTSFLQPGKYSYSLVVSNSVGCKDSIYHKDSIEIIKPTVTLSFSDSSICKNETITVDAHHNKDLEGLVHYWRFENVTYPGTTPSLLSDSGDIRFTAPGTYSYTYSYYARQGIQCRDTFKGTALVKVSGTDMSISSTNDDGCPVMNTTLNSAIDRTQNYENTEPNFVYQWKSLDTFMKFVTPTLPSTQASISAKGIKYAKLIYTDLSGCTDSTALLPHYSGVSANFSSSPQACLGGETKMISVSSLNPTSYKWYSDSSGVTFSPDNTSSTVNVSFDTTGRFPISLIAFKGGCSDTITRKITSVDIKAEFYSPRPVNQCAPVVVEFIDTSNNPNITQRLWQFGDGSEANTGRISKANHVYSDNTDTAGIDISLIVQNNYGCIDTLTKKGYVKILGPIPSFAFGNGSGCEPLNVEFINNSKFFSRIFVDYGDGGTLDSSNVTRHTYRISDANNLAEVYKPKIVLYDNNGCFVEYELEDSIYVIQNAIADFEMEKDTGCETFRASFINKSQRSFSYEWDFNNDGSIDNQDEDPFTFYAAGKHYPVLIAKSPTGCYDTLRNHKEIYVHAKPNADFDILPDSTCYLFPVDFRDLSTKGNDSAKIVSWFYDFGEELKIFDTATTANASYNYTYIGNNLVTHTVTDDNGCLDSVKKFVYIRDTLDPTNNGISYVTVKDNQDIEINWLESQIAVYKSYHLYEDEANLLTNIYNSSNISDTTFLVQSGIDVNARRYCYTTKITDTCLRTGPAIKSHCNIYLRAMDTFLGATQLRWSHYEGWDRRLNYDIFRRHPDSANFIKLASVSGNTNVYIDDSLCDFNYCYYVVCNNRNGVWKSRSNNACNTPEVAPPQVAPIIDYVTVRGKELTEIKWHMPPNNAMLDYYTIYRSDVANGPQGKRVGTSNMQLYFDQDVETESTPYTYRVNTTDICGYSSPLSEGSNTIYISGKNVNDTVLISWNPYIFWNKGVNSYIIEMRDNNYEMNEVARVQGSVNDFSINSLTLDITDSLCFRIIALEDSTAIDSSYSNIGCIAPKSRVFVPTAFSPNGDGLNESFKPVSIFLYNDKGNTIFDYTFEVYNRWGEKVFSAEDVNDSWDGTYKGKPVQGGIYLWRVDALGLDGVYHTYSGRVTLIR
jgi:gliding motility-associated-like protein